MKRAQRIALVAVFTLSFSSAAMAGTITGSRTAGTITGSRAGTITGSKAGTITGSGVERTGTITGSAPTINSADATVPTIGRVMEALISLVW